MDQAKLFDANTVLAFALTQVSFESSRPADIFGLILFEKQTNHVGLIQEN